MAIIDTREQAPLDLSPLRSEAGTLATGDYSVKGLVDVVAIERKSLTDLLGCIGQDRERFDREVIRLLAYPTRAIIVEATWGQIEAGNWKSKVTPAAAIGSACWDGLLGACPSSWPETTSGRVDTFPGCSTQRREGDGGNCGFSQPPSAPRRTARSRNP